MSMHHENKKAHHEDDESWMEAEIQRELDALNSEDIEDENDTEIYPNNIEDSSSDQDESNDKARTVELDAYIHRMQSQTARLEQELDECDQLLQRTDLIVSTPCPEQDDLVALAKEQGMDAETLKKKVLEELNREDMEDERLMLESVNEDWDQPEDEPPANTVTLDSGDGRTVPDSQSTFLTGMEEQKVSEEEEYRQLKRNFLGYDSDKGEEMEEEGEKEQSEEEGERSEEQENEDQPVKLTLKPGEGTIMSMVDSEALERRVNREVLEWEVKWMKKNEERERELAAIILEETQRQEEIRREREERQRILEEQQKALHQQQEAEEKKLRKEAEVLQEQIEQSMEQYEVEIEQLTNSVRMESEALLQVKGEGEKQHEEKRHLAALKIQAAYRGYRVYKNEGLQLKAHLEEWKQQKVEARIKAIDESRKKKEEARKKKEEEEKRRIDAEERRKEEELKRKEEGKQKKEEERKKKEEEKKIKAEEAKKKKEEEEQRKLEEKRRKEEEKRKRKEAELKRKEEEAKQREEEKMKIEKEKEEKLRLEKLQREEEAKQLKEQEEAEEKKRNDEEQRARELEERQRQEAEAAEKRAEEEKLKQLNVGTPRSPVPPEGRPKSPRKKINDLRRSAMSPLANDIKSPPSSAGSRSSEPSQEPEPGQPDGEQTTMNSQQDMASHTARSSLKTPRTARSDISLSLPDLTEKRRLEWIQGCRPWSKTQRELKTKHKSGSARKPLRRPISAKTLAELSENQILQAAGVTSLQQVTTVELHDLPGCSLKTLAQCPRLRNLSVNHCRAVTTEGLGECKHLTFLDIQHNSLETLSLRDLERLVYLDVSHNSLTSVQGLEGCTALRFLRASNNRMTRISGLEGLRSLHTLDFSHNQLITTKGLGAAPTLQEVDLSHNHLPTLDDLDALGLLQVLKAAGNNIIQPPVLTNNVLLRQLVLDENSLCSVQNLAQSWLPLLRHLSLAQNSLTTLDDLSTCVLLQHLDISNNQILDVESMMPGLQSSRHVTHLKTNGNPAQEEPEYRTLLLKAIPYLVKLDAEAVSSPGERPSMTDFERMCEEQLIIWDKLTDQYRQVLGSTDDPPNVTSVHVRYFTTSHNVAVEHRYAHEYGDVNTGSVSHADKMDFNLAPGPPGVKESYPGKSDASQMKNKFELALQNVNGSNSSPFAAGEVPAAGRGSVEGVKTARRNKAGANAIGKGPRDHTASSGLAVQTAAATQIQAVWRGYQVRRDIDYYGRLSSAATTIQAAWRGHFTRKVLRELGYSVGGSRDEPLHRAATVIQALWRGHRVRKQIRYALNYARMSFDEDDLEDLDYNEVDLSAFDFDEADLERGWTPPETPQLPANNHRRSHKPNTSHAVIGKPSSSQQQAAAAKAAFDAAFTPPSQPFPLVTRPPHPPNQPRQAWRNLDSPLSEAPPGGGRPPLPPLSRMSEHSAADTLQSGSTTQRTHRSKKEEQITEEWGFKDTKTAELMMQRAKKLKYNVARKKKLSQLDPKQRLALFRKLEETTNVRPVPPPTKKILPRKEYFQAREEEVAVKHREKQREQVNHHMRTYEWLHTQVGNYPGASSSRINQGLTEATQYNSEGNLPQMDAHVIAGARPTLTGSPMSLEVQSLDSVSTAGELHRRHSSGGDPASRLPPIKVSSAPSAHVQERMSFRNPRAKPTIESVGWGGGKKRSNRR